MVWIHGLFLMAINSEGCSSVEPDGVIMTCTSRGSRGRGSQPNLDRLVSPTTSVFHADLSVSTETYGKPISSGKLCIRIYFYSSFRVIVECFNTF